MNASMNETTGPLSYRHSAYPPLLNQNECFLWFKITDRQGSELGMCFASAASLLALAHAATQAAESLALKQAEYPADDTVPLEEHPDLDDVRSMPATSVG